MTDKILMYEELSLNALPALQTQFYDGWVLRFTVGYSYTSRANSVNMLYGSTLDLDTKIAECERRYFGLDKPAVFKITDSTDADIDNLLSQKGYTALAHTYLMTAELPSGQYLSNDCIFTYYIDKDWLDTYFTLSKYTDCQKIAVANQVFGNIKTDVVCGRLIKESVAVACGLMVIERGYAGLYNVVTDENQRGKGYGMELCKALLSEAYRIGAHTAYLQAVQENTTAINLYKKLGFMAIYSYWYRAKEKTKA